MDFVPDRLQSGCRFRVLTMKYHYREQPREGDDIRHISNRARIQGHDLEWTITLSLKDISVEIIDARQGRLQSEMAG